MKSLSRVLKASTVIIDENKVVNVEIMDQSLFRPAEEVSLVPVDDSMSETEAIELSEQVLDEANRKAKKIIDDAMSEAQRAVADMQEKAEFELDGIRANAYEEAFEEGHKRGEEEAKRIIGEAEHIRTQALIDKNTLLNSAEPEIVELIASIVKKLIGDTFELRPELILFLVKQGLAQMSITGEITVHVSQEDYDVVIAEKAEIQSMADAGAKIEIMKDLSLNSSDCIIETQFGNIDCSLGQQYEALKENLFYICKNRFAVSNG